MQICPRPSSTVYCVVIPLQLFGAMWTTLQIRQQAEQPCLGQASLGSLPSSAIERGLFQDEEGPFREEGDISQCYPRRQSPYRALPMRSVRASRIVLGSAPACHLYVPPKSLLTGQFRFKQLDFTSPQHGCLRLVSLRYDHGAASLRVHVGLVLAMVSYLGSSNRNQEVTVRGPNHTAEVMSTSIFDHLSYHSQA